MLDLYEEKLPLTLCHTVNIYCTQIVNSTNMNVTTQGHLKCVKFTACKGENILSSWVHGHIAVLRFHSVN